MNDLDLVRDLRADVPSPTRERLAPGRARLLASISRPSRPRYARRAVLLVTAAASAVAVASGTAPASAEPIQSTPAQPQRYVNPEAHDAYLQGRYLWMGGNFVESQKCFEKAIQLQSDYAPPWGGLSMSFLLGADAGRAPTSEAVDEIWLLPPHPSLLASSNEPE